MAVWTNDQQKAIYKPSGGGSILVSAAAGSGKTAVLVERIAEMVMREENPVPVDRLLVVTFTEAAAAEMKERIIARLNAAQREAVKNHNAAKARYLKEQIHLTATADINTIDSFCLSVVKNNFHILGIDPNFSIMDENEGELIMDDAFEELFSRLYEEGDERFDALVKMFGTSRSDEGLKEVVRKIYKFTQSFAEPRKWLREKADMYSADMTSSKWVNSVFLEDRRNEIIRKHEDFWKELTDCMLEAVVNECGIDPDSYSSYADIGEAAEYWGKLWTNVCRCREAVIALKRSDSLDSLFTFYKTYIEKKALLGAAMNKIPAKKQADDDEWQYYYDAYDYMRDDLRGMCMCLPLSGKADFNEYVHAADIKKTVDSLVWLTEELDVQLDIKKTKRNVKSFSDIEHLAYRLFADNENIRGEYAERYEEILIDEYQDTNGLQDAIFSSISRNRSNIFMVGDLKQSIYKFRGGDPMIFKEKNRLFSCGEGGSRIMLSQNFRSRREVLDSVNTVFGKMMSDGVGDVEYNGGEALERETEREYYPEGGNDYISEYYDIAAIGKTGDDVTADSAEAECIASRIQSLVREHFQVFDGEDGTRDISYRDIVVLMRSVKNVGLLREALEKRSIPVFVQKEEYFERREIKLMLSLLSLINNHLQDIPLTAVMRSPIGGFTDSELAMIKLESTGRSFYKAVKNYKADGGEAEERLSRKCRRFTMNLDRWRGYVKMKSIASLIWTLYEETGFYDFMGALEGGEEAQANLKLLYERAKRYEESGFKGIFNFIRYIERMGNRRDDISGARLVNESHNVVRIMTIHKSKGLEFPVVFLARTSKNFAVSSTGAESKVLLHAKYGIGVDYYNYDDMYFKRLMFTSFIKSRNEAERRSEEIRLMYVAMTRAKEKLIVTSAKGYKDEDDYRTKKAELRRKYMGMAGLRRAAEEAKSYSDWIYPALLRSGEGWHTHETLVSSLDYETEEADEGEITVAEPEKVRELVERILEYSYRYPKSGAVPAKTSVTAIKEMADEYTHKSQEDAPVYMTAKPAFLRDENMGARIGTAHHQVMAFIDIDTMRDIEDIGYETFVEQEIIRIAADGQIERDIARNEEITDTIRENVCGFFRSEMGKRVLRAKRIYREKPFEIEITAKDYDSTLGSEYEDEQVIVQGIIDLYFEEENGDIILVDYKTDRCKTEEEQLAVANRYRSQLALYERAMKKILKRNVKEKYLYLFSVQNMIKLD